MANLEPSQIDKALHDNDVQTLSKLSVAELEQLKA